MTYLNALGIINALGSDVDSVRAGLLDGHTGGLVTSDHAIPGRRIRVGAIRAALPDIEQTCEKLASRNNAILQAAIEQIRPQIEAALERYGPARVGVVLGGGTSGILEGQTAYTARLKEGRFPPGFDYRRQEIGAPTEYFRQAFRLQGPAFSISTACTASAKAFASGRRLLRTGLCDAVVVGGVDSLCSLTLSGFDALESIDDNRCNPFSKNRNGINIGEGAAVFLMTREPGPVRLSGIGESSDAYHISAPDPAGRGATLAMHQALADAGAGAGAVDYVNLHGTATPQNDLMESRAVASALGSDVPCSSTKSLTGHLLGAAGATEAAFCWMLLAANGQTRLPPHVWDGVVDPDLAPLTLCAEDETRDCQLTLSNSFAFGGNNACVILEKG